MHGSSLLSVTHCIQEAMSGAGGLCLSNTCEFLREIEINGLHLGGFDLFVNFNPSQKRCYQLVNAFLKCVPVGPSRTSVPAFLVPSEVTALDTYGTVAERKTALSVCRILNVLLFGEGELIKKISSFL